MSEIVLYAKISNNNIVVRDDLKPMFSKFKEDNNSSDVILNISVFFANYDNFDIYYKTEALPTIARLISLKFNKNVSIGEVDFAIRSMFLTFVVKNEDKKQSLVLAKRFEDCERIEQLNLLSSLNIWCYNVFKVYLPKLKTSKNK